VEFLTASPSDKIVYSLIDFLKGSTDACISRRAASRSRQENSEFVLSYGGIPIFSGVMDLGAVCEQHFVVRSPSITACPP
jgi:hypothetical protein